MKSCVLFQVGRLPGMHSSNLMAETLSGQLDTVDFEDVLSSMCAVVGDSGNRDDYHNSCNFLLPNIVQRRDGIKKSALLASVTKFIFIQNRARLLIGKKKPKKNPQRLKNLRAPNFSRLFHHSSPVKDSSIKMCM